MAEIHDIILAMVAILAAAFPTVIAAVVWALKSSHKQNDILMKHDEKMRITLENHLIATIESLKDFSSAFRSHDERMMSLFGKWEERWDEQREKGSKMWKKCKTTKEETVKQPETP